MSEFEALLLGIVQGLTEFLPISSSGHLIIVPWLLDFHYLEQHPAFNKTFDVAIHMGTLVAALAYFWPTVRDLIAATFSAIRKRRLETDSERLAWYLFLATLPAAAIGALGAEFIEERLGQPWQIAILLAAFGLVLYAADRLPQRKDLKQLSAVGALFVGFAQAISLAPGTSRSGITITAARMLGLNRDAAARFSFLLLIPVTAGAGLYKGWQVIDQGLPPGALGPFAVGVIASALSGVAAIWFVLKLVRRHSYGIFVAYRLALAAFVALLILTGVQPSTFS